MIQKEVLAVTCSRLLDMIAKIHRGNRPQTTVGSIKIKAIQRMDPKNPTFPIFSYTIRYIDMILLYSKISVCEWHIRLYWQWRPLVYADVFSMHESKSLLSLFFLNISILSVYVSHTCVNVHKSKDSYTHILRSVVFLSINVNAHIHTHTHTHTLMHTYKIIYVCV